MSPPIFPSLRCDYQSRGEEQPPKPVHSLRVLSPKPLIIATLSAFHVMPVTRLRFSDECKNPIYWGPSSADLQHVAKKEEPFCTCVVRLLPELLEFACRTPVYLPTLCSQR